LKDASLGVKRTRRTYHLAVLAQLRQIDSLDTIEGSRREGERPERQRRAHRIDSLLTGCLYNLFFFFFDDDVLPQLSLLNKNLQQKAADRSHANKKIKRTQAIRLYTCTSLA
jgi:hypothetical protein